MLNMTNDQGFYTPNPTVLRAQMELWVPSILITLNTRRV
uniref:Uncharacterized protein n=1 Tax=Anguilla anguilla TaxID=7936 RepID=A0A0E9VIY6_ANGAN